MINPHALTQSLAGGSERSMPQCTLVIKKNMKNFFFFFYGTAVDFSCDT